MNYSAAPRLSYVGLLGRSLLTAVVGGLLASMLLWLLLSADVAVRNGTPLNLAGDWGFVLGFAFIAVPLAWAGLLLIGIPLVLSCADFVRGSALAAHLIGAAAGVACGGLAAMLVFFFPAVPFGMFFGAVIGRLWVALARPLVLAARPEAR